MSGLDSGIVEVKVNGAVMFIEGEWSYDDGTPRKEPQQGENFTAAIYKPQPRQCAGNAKFETLSDETAFTSIKSETFTLRFTNGEVMTFEDAWATKTGEANATTGLIPVQIVARLNPNSRKGM